MLTFRGTSTLLAAAVMCLGIPSLTPPCRGDVPRGALAVHLKGRQHKVNVYSAIDSYRPLLGAHIYFTTAVKHQLNALGDIFDFVAHDNYEEQNLDALDNAQLPWIQVYHNNIPMGSWDANRIRNTQLGAVINRVKQDHAYCLGFCTGSEPHFSPDYSYTGHTKREVDSMIISPESSVDFGNWMHSLYGDDTPQTDTNRDGVCFASDFGWSSSEWSSLGTKMPEDCKDKPFLQTLFKEHIIGDDIKLADRNYHDPNHQLVITSRLLSPQYPATFGQSLRQLRYPSDALGITYYTHSQQVKNPIGGGAPVQVSAYDPAITELRGSYVYQLARQSGVRPFYNEFQSGNADGNTRGNIYRAVFHELQYKPAAINWFCYAGGQPYTPFAWMDCHYMATDLALLRNHLELMQPYRHISRSKRDLAVFLPVAWPKPVDADTNYEMLAPQLEKYGADVFLSDDLQQYKNYKRIIVVLGFIDGATDAYLLKFLQNIPTGTKVLVICASSHLYCEPGVRGSRDFRNSLQGNLPVYPASDELTTAMIVNRYGVCELKVPKVITTNEQIAAHGKPLNSEGRTVGWQNDRLMVLAGMPTKGLGSIIRSFMGLSVASQRRAGRLHILNRDAIADAPGYYCVAEGQKLQVSPLLMAYDVVTRQPVVGSVSRPAVVWVMNPTELQVVDTSTAKTQVISQGGDRTVLDITLPRFDFAYCPRILTVASETPPRVFYRGHLIPVKQVALGFYSCSIPGSGRYVVSR